MPPAFGGEDPPVHPLNGMQDEGKFTYYINEEYVGTSSCTWSLDGTFENSAVIRMGGQQVVTSLSIEVDERGLWTSISMESARGPVLITRDGTSAETTFNGEAKPLKLKPNTFVMEDMSPALMSQAIRAYDHVKGGKQRFPLFFIPAVPIDGALEYQESFDRIIRGRQCTFRKYFYQMAPIYNVYVVVDEHDRVCLAEYPFQHGVFIRDGYDMLNVKDASDALLSKPEYEVVEEMNVGVPMRDGIKLAMDVYRPMKEEKSPVILVRTPYKKEMSALQARFYARRGYAFAIQDVRGRFSSPGEWIPFVHEADDGYDTIEWLANQPWSDGNVGMIGASYLGWVQWWAAGRRPSHLKTLIPNVAPPDPYFNFPHEYGVFFLGAALWWSDVVEKGATADLSGMAMMEAYEIFESDKMMHLPVIELDEVLFGKKLSYYREWIAHPNYDEYWKNLSFMKKLEGFDIPVFHQSGWFDGDGIGSKLNYTGMVEHGHKNQKLVLGPWGHVADDRRYGPRGIDWGPRAVIDLQKSYLRWMDRWLKGIDNGIDREPSVSLFVMGSNDWLHGNAYPLEGTKMTKFYLASAGDAVGLEGGGRLALEPPDEDVCGPDRYTYDPGDPTGLSPVDREDVLIYKTPPMEEPMTVAGPLSAVLHASSSAKDTDWIMRLAWVDENERVVPLCTGVIRARYRDSFSEPKLLEPGKIYEYHLDLWQAGVTIDKGEHLTLLVSSAQWPRFSRNLNTGGHNEMDSEYVVAEQMVYHDDEYPSHILLPIIPDPKFKKE